MARIALKIAYDGTAFHGQARQPGLRTVEGEVIHALVRARLIRDAKSSSFQSASRTDAGVSALGNLVAFDSPLAPSAAGRAFNGKSRGVWAWAVAKVPDDFSARRARERWYRYRLDARHDVAALDAALRVFEGEHDFRNFTRDRARTVARIDLSRASKDAGGLALDFKAPSFRWNLVRRFVAAAMRVESAEATIPLLERALSEKTRVDLGLAPPEPLTLMDVSYDVPFDRLADPTTRSRLEALREERERGHSLLREIHEKFSAP